MNIIKKNTIVMALLALAITMTVTGCTNSKSEIVDSGNIMSSAQENSEIIKDDTDSTLKIDKTYIEEAIKQNTLIYKNFSFETSHNQQILVTENNNYVGEETWLYNGILNKGISDLVIEGNEASYSISITFGGNKEYPTNISVTFISENDVDMSNMLTWTYETIGTALPPKLAKGFQNADFGKKVENCYTEDGIQADVYKENIKNSDGSVTSALSIMISDNVDEVVYMNKADFDITNDFEIKLLDKSKTAIEVEQIISEIINKELDTNTQMISKYSNEGITDRTESLYAAFNTGGIETTVNAVRNTELSTGESKKSFIISTKTDGFNTKSEALGSVAKIIEGMTGEIVEINTEVQEDKLEIKGEYTYHISVTQIGNKFEATILGEYTV